MSLAKRVFPVATVLFLLGLAIFLFPPTQHLLSPVPRVHAATRTIVLVGTVAGWNVSTNKNPTISVTQGDTITVQLSATDTTHQFYVDVDRNGVADCPNPPTSSPDKCSAFFSPGSPTSFTFTVDFAASTTPYTYYCSIHPATMLGSFIVQAPPPTPDFTIASNPSSLTILQGSSSTSTITLTSVSGFSGTINLATGISPSGPTPSLSPMSVTISSTTPATSTLTVSTASSTPSGTYSVKVNGTSGSTVHTTTVTVQVNTPAGQDFGIASSPASLNVTQGSSSSSTITLTSVNGFSGILSLTETISPTGPTVTLSPTSVSLPASSSVTSTVTVSAVASVATGSYSLNITATNGSLSHSKIVAVTVSSTTSPPSGTGGLPVVVLVGAAVVIIAALGVVLYLVRRKPVAK